MTDTMELGQRLVEGVRAAVKDRGPYWMYPLFNGTNPEWFADNDPYVASWDPDNPDPVIANEGVTSTCRNFLPDGTPACIVGYAAHYAGLDIPACGGVGDIFVGEEDADSGYASAFTFSGEPKIAVPRAVLLALVEAQDIQDTRHTWGVALEEFELRLKGMGWKE